MAIEDQLRERLRKVEALFVGGATAGERDAAGAAAARLRAKLEEAARFDRPIEMKFTMPDMWSVRLWRCAGATASSLSAMAASVTRP